jgi:hypothetical protein
MSRHQKGSSMAHNFLWMSENDKHGLPVAPLVMTGYPRVLMTISGERKVDKIKSAIGAFKEFYKVQTVVDDIEIGNLGKWVVGPKQVADAHF